MQFTGLDGALLHHGTLTDDDLLLTLLQDDAGQEERANEDHHCNDHSQDDNDEVVAAARFFNRDLLGGNLSSLSLLCVCVRLVLIVAVRLSITTIVGPVTIATVVLSIITAIVCLAT